MDMVRLVVVCGLWRVVLVCGRNLRCCWRGVVDGVAVVLCCFLVLRPDCLSIGGFVECCCIVVCRAGGVCRVGEVVCSGCCCGYELLLLNSCEQCNNEGID